MDDWNFVPLCVRANHDVTTHNAQGQSSWFRGRTGRGAGGAKRADALQTPRNFSPIFVRTVNKFCFFF